MLGDMEAVVEQRRLTEEYLAPYPAGYRAWCRDALVPDVGGGMVGWRREPWHAAFDKAISEGQDVIFPKKRNVHFTTELIMYHLYRMMWEVATDAIYVTVNEDEAYRGPQSYKARMEQTYRALPEWQRVSCPLRNGIEGAFGTQGDIVMGHLWLKGGEAPSTLMVRPATGNVGATGKFHYASLDEMARWEFPDATYASVKPSIDRAGGLTIMGGTLEADTPLTTRMLLLMRACRQGKLRRTRVLGAYWGTMEGETPEEWRAGYEEAEAQGDWAALEYKRLYPRNEDDLFEMLAAGLASGEDIAACWQAVTRVALPAELAELAGV